MTIDTKMIGNGAMCEVLNIDLRTPLSQRQFDEIYAQYVQYGGLLFRDQENLDPDTYVDFCARFGALIEGDLPSLSFEAKYEETEIADTDDSRYAHLKSPYIFVISNVEENGKPVGLSKAGLYWHSDQYYIDRPSKGTSLFGIEIPDSGGNTLIVNMYQVYEALPQATKDRLEGLRIEHSYVTAWPHLYPTRKPLSKQEQANTPDMTHELVQSHAESGRKLLYFGALYDKGRPGIRLLGLPDIEAAPLLDELREFTLDQRFVYSHAWRRGDILLTDNRCLMHCATPFNDSVDRRVLYRTTVRGEQTGVPVN